jgi:CRISPR-associated protein Cas6
MTALQAMADTVVDAVFPIKGSTLPRDHALPLQQLLTAQWPWLETDPLAGIHAIKMVQGSLESGLLSQRARLVLRVTAQRSVDLLALPRLELSVAGHRIDLGPAHLRELQPHATLYAYKVAAESADEMGFMALVERELAYLEIAGERVCGKHQKVRADGTELNAFSLMLHSLPAQQSLRLQQHGLGRHRLLGCGIFVAHKSAAAV